MGTWVTENTLLKEARKLFPELEQLLLKIGYAPITRMIMSMSKPDSLTISNIARASGLTEIEIGLLVEELNDRLPMSTRIRVRGGTKPRTKGKAQAQPRIKTKSNAKTSKAATRTASKTTKGSAKSTAGAKKTVAKKAAKRSAAKGKK